MTFFPLSFLLFNGYEYYPRPTIIKKRSRPFENGAYLYAPFRQNKRIHRPAQVGLVFRVHMSINNFSSEYNGHGRSRSVGYNGKGLG